MTFAGVDVGGPRKGFHVAVVDRGALVAGPIQLRTPQEVVAWLAPRRPRVVAVDSPRVAAPDGRRSRECERAIARAICCLRYTPDRARIRANPYYGWIAHGFALYALLARVPWAVIECFPTASWTRWEGSRRPEPRGAWSARGLERLRLRGVPSRLGQDARDAIAAAVTAELYGAGETEAFGEIEVPLRATTRRRRFSTAS